MSTRVREFTTEERVRRVERARQWQRENRDRYNAYQREYYRKHRKRLTNRARLYKVSAEELASWLQERPACEICGGTERLHVDHDHKTGRLRGVLCNTCNGGIGFFHEDIDKMRAAIAYLTAHSS